MLSLTFGGDTSLGDVHISRAAPHLQDTLRANPEWFFEGVSPLLSGSDEIIVNLETVLSENPVSPWEGKKRFLGWDTPTQTLRALKSIGVSVVSLANNHTMDFGWKVLDDTMSHLARSGISQVGAGGSLLESFSPHIIPYGGNGSAHKIYLFSGMQVQKSLRDDYDFYAAVDSGGVAPASQDRLCLCIRATKVADPKGLIIVMPHWGRNYRWASKSMRSLEASFYEAGADIVIGHGAHMLQQLQATGQSATIFSLGNFVFNWAGRFDKFDAPPFGLVARLEVEPKGERVWRVNLKAYPILSNNRDTGYKPRPVTAEEFERVAEVVGSKSGASFSERFKAGRDERGWGFCYDFYTSK